MKNDGSHRRTTSDDCVSSRVWMFFRPIKKESLILLRHLETQQKLLNLSMEKLALDRCGSSRSETIEHYWLYSGDRLSKLSCKIWDSIRCTERYFSLPDGATAYLSQTKLQQIYREISAMLSNTR